MSEKRILVLRQNLALRTCRTAVHFLLPLFREIYNQLFRKRLRGHSPLTPYNTAKSKNDGLSGKNFSGGLVFPDNKAFWKLCFARCLKKTATFFCFTVYYRIFGNLPKMGAKKKQQIFFRLTASCAATGRRLFSCKIKEGGSTLGYRPLGCTFAKTGGAVNGGRSPFTCR